MVHQPQLYLHSRQTPPLPLSLRLPPDVPDTAVSSAMCLWAEDVDVPVDIARQAILYVHANLASELSQHPSTDCTCLSKPLQALMVTAIRAVTGDASFHLLYGSDARSDSSGAAPATDSTVADSPSMPTTSATATTAAPRRSDRQHKPAAAYWKVPSTASVSQCQWAPGEAEAGGIVCSPASWK